MIKVIIAGIIIIIAAIIASFGNDAQGGGTGWADFKEWIKRRYHGVHNRSRRR